MHGNRLGRYLTARRALVHPADVGFPSDDGHRRVAGLRREEVAALAGVSAQYYLRLEQGLAQRPSDQVLNALARALQLDGPATAYLYQLAHPPPSRSDTRPSDEVEDRTRWLLDSWTSTPAVVHSRFLDVLASNAAARALSPTFSEGSNSLVALLLEPSQRKFYDDWEGIAERSVALLRSLVGVDTDDGRLTQVVAELSMKSELFQQVWSRGDVNLASTGVHHIRHPVLGKLELHHRQLALSGDNGQSIFIYHAAPGSASAISLARLSFMVP